LLQPQQYSSQRRRKRHKNRQTIVFFIALWRAGRFALRVVSIHGTAIVFAKAVSKLSAASSKLFLLLM
jgi:hypothetical protein